MKVKLYTSLSGLNNRVNGKRMFVFTADSSMSNPIDNIEVWVDDGDIVEVYDTGMILIEMRKGDKQ